MIVFLVGHIWHNAQLRVKASTSSSKMLQVVASQVEELQKIANKPAPKRYAAKKELCPKRNLLIIKA